jgi:proteasome lid subunit RPN8/RPN11
MATTKRLTEAAQRVNPVAPVHIWRSPDHSSVDMLIVTHLSVYSTIHEHASAALPNETGGFLVGRVGQDGRDGCWHLEIEEAIPVQPESQNPVHFTFTWRDVDRVRNYREGHNKALIGWYHTHPQLGIFLSETDIERTHRVLFSEPFQVALVFDPVGGRAGYFFWEAAQTIDSGHAAWREFEIAVQPPPVSEPPPAPPPGPPASIGGAGRSEETAPMAAWKIPALREDVEPPPPARAPAVNLLWAVVLSVFFIITGLAVGYFWFGPGRGLP